MVPSPATVLRAVLHRVVLPVRRAVRPFLRQTEGPSDPLSHQVFGLVAGLLGFAGYAAAVLLGALATAGYALCYPLLRAGERAVERCRGCFDRLG